MTEDERSIPLSLTYDEFHVMLQAVSLEMNHLGQCGLETTVHYSLFDKLTKIHDEFNSLEPTPKSPIQVTDQLKALEHYADPRNWENGGFYHKGVYYSGELCFIDTNNPGYAIAQAALAQK